MQARPPLHWPVKPPSAGADWEPAGTHIGAQAPLPSVPCTQRLSSGHSDDRPPSSREGSHGPAAGAAPACWQKPIVPTLESDQGTQVPSLVPCASHGA